MVWFKGNAFINISGSDIALIELSKENYEDFEVYFEDNYFENIEFMGPAPMIEIRAAKVTIKNLTIKNSVIN